MLRGWINNWWLHGHCGKVHSFKAAWKDFPRLWGHQDHSYSPTRASSHRGTFFVSPLEPRWGAWWAGLWYGITSMDAWRLLLTYSMLHIGSQGSLKRLPKALGSSEPLLLSNQSFFSQRDFLCLYWASMGGLLGRTVVWHHLHGHMEVVADLFHASWYWVSRQLEKTFQQGSGVIRTTPALQPELQHRQWPNGGLIPGYI